MERRIIITLDKEFFKKNADMFCKVFFEYAFKTLKKLIAIVHAVSEDKPTSETFH